MTRIDIFENVNQGVPTRRWLAVVEAIEPTGEGPKIIACVNFFGSNREEVQTRAELWLAEERARSEKIDGRTLRRKTVQEEDLIG